MNFAMQIRGKPDHRRRNHGGSGGWRPPTFYSEHLIEIIPKCVIQNLLERYDLCARYSIKRIAK